MISIEVELVVMDFAQPYATFPRWHLLMVFVLALHSLDLVHGLDLCAGMPDNAKGDLSSLP